MRLSAADLNAVLAFVERVDGAAGLDDFGRRLTNAFCDLVPNDLAVYQENDYERRSEHHIPSSDDYAPTREHDAIYWSHHEENLLDVHYARTGDLAPHRMTDFMTHGELRRTTLYDGYFRDVGIEFQLALPLVETYPHEVIIVGQRATRNFSQRDVALLEAAAPRVRHAYALARARETIGSLEDALEFGAHAVVLLRGGRVVEATPRASELLHAYFGDGHGPRALPAELDAWLRAEPNGHAHVVSRPGTRLVIRALTRYDDGSVKSLALVEKRTAPARESLAALGLTRRETEVLELVAAGKTNPEVAEALVITRRTVKKHLEQIYDKLGVRTRTAAAARAFGA